MLFSVVKMKIMASTLNKRIEKGIYKRGPYSFQVKIMVDGTLFSSTQDTLEDARAYRDSKRAALSLDDDTSRVLKSRVRKAQANNPTTLAVALERYKREVSAKKKSADKEVHTISKISRAKIARMSIYHIAPEDISNYLKSMVREQKGPLQGKPLSDTTKRKHAALLSHLFTIARKRWQWNVINPVIDIELPTPGKPRKRRLEDNEEMKLVAELQKARNKHILPLFEMAIETACRQGELLSLEWRDVKISGSHGTALLRDTKNGEDRIVPLNSAACAILSGMARPINGGRVFPVDENALRTACDTCAPGTSRSTR